MRRRESFTIHIIDDSGHYFIRGIRRIVQGIIDDINVGGGVRIENTEYEIGPATFKSCSNWQEASKIDFRRTDLVFLDVVDNNSTECHKEGYSVFRNIKKSERAYGRKEVIWISSCIDELDLVYDLKDSVTRGSSMPAFFPYFINVDDWSDPETIQSRKEYMFLELLLRTAFERVIFERNYKRTVKNLREELEFSKKGSESIIGESEAIKDLKVVISKFARSNGTVHITGEPGTGKELVAKALHYISNRRDTVLVAINCSTIPSTLFESEIFGHKKGAYSGAKDDRKGAFLSAHNGTLFLDEIGELPLDIQPKLLRVLQVKEIRQLGKDDETKVDVRVITATNKDLKKEIDNGRFRQDLYDRINILPISLPPLRDRADDVPMLIEHFLSKESIRNGITYRLTDEAIQYLIARKSPDNVRGLENIVQKGCILCDAGEVTYEDLTYGLSSEEIYASTAVISQLTGNEDNNPQRSKTLQHPKFYDKIKNTRLKTRLNYLISIAENAKGENASCLAKLCSFLSTDVKIKDDGEYVYDCFCRTIDVNMPDTKLQSQKISSILDIPKYAAKNDYKQPFFGALVLLLLLSHCTKNDIKSLDDFMSFVNESSKNFFGYGTRSAIKNVSARGMLNPVGTSLGCKKRKCPDSDACNDIEYLLYSIFKGILEKEAA